MNFTRYRRLGMTAALALVLGGCGTLDRSATPALEAGSRWALLPFANVTDTPMAGQRAEAVTEGLLRSLGVRQVLRYPEELEGESLLESGGRRNHDKAVAWAKRAGARYAVTGTVDEWRYKVGVSGEPAVGLALNIVDLNDESVVWSGVAGKSGWSRQAVSGVAQEVIRDMLAPVVKGK